MRDRVPRDVQKLPPKLPKRQPPAPDDPVAGPHTRPAAPADAFGSKLAALIANGAQLSAAKIGEEIDPQRRAELEARAAWGYDAAADKVAIPRVSQALVGAIEARRTREIELAETEPAQPPRLADLSRQRVRALERAEVKDARKKARELERLERAQSEQRRRFEDSYYPRAPTFAPKQWIGEDYAFAAHLRRIGGGNASRRVSAIFHVGAQRLRRACLGIEPIYDETGTRIRGWTEPVRSWSDATAQDIAAVGLTLLRYGAATKRVGWNRVTSGISEGMIATLLVNRLDGEPMDRRTIERHVRALRKAKFFYSEQPPAAVADPSTVGPSGHALNLYYFSDRVCEVLVAPRRKAPESSETGPGRTAEAEGPSSGVPPPS